MKFFRSYLQTLQNSASDPSYYRDILSLPFWSSVRFFILTLFLVSSMSSLWWRLVEFPMLFSTFSKQVDTVLLQIPEDAVFYYDGQEVSTSLKHPFVLKSTQELRDVGAPADLLAILDEGTSSSALLQLYPRGMVIKDPNTEKSPTIAYTEFLPKENLTVTKKMIVENKDKALKKLPTFATYGLLLSIPFLWIALVIGNMFTLLLFTIGTQIIFWMSGIKIRYQKAFQLGLHALSIAVIVDKVARHIFPQTPFSLLTLAFFGILLLVVWELRRQKGFTYG